LNNITDLKLYSQELPIEDVIEFLETRYKNLDRISIHRSASVSLTDNFSYTKLLETIIEHCVKDRYCHVSYWKGEEHIQIHQNVQLLRKLFHFSTKLQKFTITCFNKREQDDPLESLSYAYDQLEPELRNTGKLKIN